MMGHRHSTCRHRLARAAIVLLAAGPLLASAQAWNGNGPFAPSNGKGGTVHALAIDAATGTVYAGTGSGTVFALNDASLSQPPSAADDAVVTSLVTSIDIDVLANDTDPEGALDSSSVELQSDPLNGTATVNSDGTVTYTPDAGFVGPDGFRYTMRDRAGNESNEASVSVHVNAPPAAANDAASTLQNQPVTIDVLANDVDDDGTLDPSTVTVWNSPASGGAIAEADGRITFTPAPDFSGPISFTYRVSDDDGAASNEATVTVTVTAVDEPNVPPVADDDSANTSQGVPVIIAVLENDSDADGTLVPSTVTVQSAPASGSTAVNADGSITYSPDADFVGTDTFTYTVRDDNGAIAAAATVTVSVTAAAEPTPTPTPTPTPSPSPTPQPPRRSGGGGSSGLLLLAALALVGAWRRMNARARLARMTTAG